MQLADETFAPIAGLGQGRFRLSCLNSHVVNLFGELCILSIVGRDAERFRRLRTVVVGKLDGASPGDRRQKQRCEDARPG